MENIEVAKLVDWAGCVTGQNRLIGAVYERVGSG